MRPDRPVAACVLTDQSLAAPPRPSFDPGELLDVLRHQRTWWRTVTTSRSAIQQSAARSAGTGTAPGCGTAGGPAGSSTSTAAGSCSDNGPDDAQDEDRKQSRPSAQEHHERCSDVDGSDERYDGGHRSMSLGGPHPVGEVGVSGGDVPFDAPQFPTLVGTQGAAAWWPSVDRHVRRPYAGVARCRWSAVSSTAVPKGAG
jgi:hypothetical protein